VSTSPSLVNACNSGIVGKRFYHVIGETDDIKIKHHITSSVKTAFADALDFKCAEVIETRRNADRIEIRKF
jgi:hypothetical protein